MNAKARLARVWRLALLATFAAAAVAMSFSIDVRGAIASALAWIESQGAIGATVFIALYVAATVVGFPGLPLSLGAGAVYGLWIGFTLVSLGSTLGATAAFLVARYLARNWITDRIASSPQFRAIDEGVASAGWKLVFLTRLSPVFPFNLQNYAYGLTRVHLGQYVLASWIGMMPGTLMIVYLGHAAGSVAAALTRERSKSPAEWALFAFGLAATVAAAFLATRMARLALKTATPSVPPTQE